MASLDGKVFAITGGASGIGLATAKGLAKRGATVCIADVDLGTDAPEYFAELSTPYMLTKVDVSHRNQVEAWLDSILTKFSQLDGAANVAGIIGKHHGLRTVAELDDDEWHKIIAVNLTGCMYCMRAELQRIRDGGSIVNVSSIHGTRGFAKFAAYDASKHGVIGLTKAAALEVGQREIRVNAVAPGAIYTPLMEKGWALHGRPKDAKFSEPTAFQRQGTAEEVANVIIFLLEDASRFVTGSVYSVDGGWM